MSYEKQIWIDGESPLNAERFNHIEEGIAAVADSNSGGNVDLSITGATAGQTVKIAAVDENGVPTAWESVDFPSEGVYALIERITTEEEVNSLHRDLPNCKALLVKYTFSAVTEITYVVTQTILGNGSSISITLALSSLNNVLGARTEVYAQNGYYTGSGYSPSVTFSNAGTALALPNDSIAKVKDDHYINGLSMHGYNGKNIPVGTKIEIWGVRV